MPDSPRSWLITVAGRRLVDEWRSESARRRREEHVALLEPAEPGAAADQDDTLTLLFLCCHPSLSPPSQLALTLRAVGGLSTAEIARAFLVPEATMAQRISRAKQRIRGSGLGFEAPPEAERADRLRVVRQVLYLVFNEGYTTSRGTGAAARRPDRRGDPADPDVAPAAARRRRDGRAARAHAAHRRAAGGAHRRVRCARAARRAGPRRAGTPR